MPASDLADRPDWLRSCARLSAWCLAAFIVYSTLSPIGLRPESGAPPDIERFGAFFVLSLTFALGYPRSRQRVAMALMLAAVLLELAQGLSPSRHGRPADAAFKVLGAGSGAFAAWAWDAFRARLSRATPRV